jgi:hypothetical protein
VNKIVFTILISMLVTICLIYSGQKLYSHTTCDDVDYLCCGSVDPHGSLVDPAYCDYDVNVLHYTAELYEDEEIYVHVQDRDNELYGFRQMIGFRNSAALCSIYGGYVWLLKGHRYRIWFQCDHLAYGDNGRDPDGFEYYNVNVPSNTCETP